MDLVVQKDLQESLDLAKDQLTISEQAREALQLQLGELVQTNQKFEEEKIVAAQLANQEKQELRQKIEEMALNFST